MGLAISVKRYAVARKAAGQLYNGRSLEVRQSWIAGLEQLSGYDSYCEGLFTINPASLLSRI